MRFKVVVFSTLLGTLISLFPGFSWGADSADGGGAEPAVTHKKKKKGAANDEQDPAVTQNNKKGSDNDEQQPAGAKKWKQGDPEYASKNYSDDLHRYFQDQLDKQLQEPTQPRKRHVLKFAEGSAQQTSDVKEGGVERSAGFAIDGKIATYAATRKKGEQSWSVKLAEDSLVQRIEIYPGKALDSESSADSDLEGLTVQLSRDGKIVADKVITAKMQGERSVDFSKNSLETSFKHTVNIHFHHKLADTIIFKSKNNEHISLAEIVAFGIDAPAKANAPDKAEAATGASSPAKGNGSKKGKKKPD